MIFSSPFLKGRRDEPAGREHKPFLFFFFFFSLMDRIKRGMLICSLVNDLISGDYTVGLFWGFKPREL